MLGFDSLEVGRITELGSEGFYVFFISDKRIGFRGELASVSGQDTVFMLD